MLIVIIISNILSDTIKSRQCSAQFLYARLGLRAVGVPTNNKMGQSLCGGLDKARHVFPSTFLVRVQCLRKGLFMAIKGPSTKPIVFSVIPESYCRRRGRFTSFFPVAIELIEPLTLLNL